MVKNCIIHRRKVGDKLLLIVDSTKFVSNPDLDHEFQILIDGKFNCIYSYTGSWGKCFDKYCEYLHELKYEGALPQIPSPDLTEYYGKRMENGGLVQGKLAVGV